MESVPGEVTAFLLVMYLLPGFLGLVVHDFLAETRPPEAFSRFIGALSLALVSNIVVGVVTGQAFGLPNFGEHPELGQVVTAFVTWRLLWLTIASGAIGFAVAYVNNRRWLFALARRLRLTDRTGRIDVWREAFQTNRGRWVQVHFKDGRTLIGWPKTYSEYGEAREMFVASAVWYVPEAAGSNAGGAAGQGRSGFRTLEVDGPGTYVGNFEEVLAIDVLT